MWGFKSLPITSLTCRLVRTLGFSEATITPNRLRGNSKEIRLYLQSPPLSCLLFWVQDLWNSLTSTLLWLISSLKNETSRVSKTFFFCVFWRGSQDDGCLKMELPYIFCTIIQTILQSICQSRIIMLPFHFTVLLIFYTVLLIFFLNMENGSNLFLLFKRNLSFSITKSSTNIFI